MVSERLEGMTKWLIALVVVFGAVAVVVGYDAVKDDGPDVRTQSSPHSQVYFDDDLGVNDGIRIRGNLTMWAGTRSELNVEDVTLLLYGADDVRGSWCLGNLSLSSEIRIDVPHPTKPHYVIFTSPEFWGDDRVVPFEVAYYRFNGTAYEERTAWEQERLPIDVTNDDACPTD